METMRKKQGMERAGEYLNRIILAERKSASEIARGAHRKPLAEVIL
jgi:hypothetical protein